MVRALEEAGATVNLKTTRLGGTPVAITICSKRRHVEAVHALNIETVACNILCTIYCVTTVIMKRIVITGCGVSMKTMIPARSVLFCIHIIRSIASYTWHNGTVCQLIGICA